MNNDEPKGLYAIPEQERAEIQAKLDALLPLTSLTHLRSVRLNKVIADHPSLLGLLHEHETASEESKSDED